MTELSEKTIQLMQLAVDMAGSVAADLEEPEQQVSQETIDILIAFKDLYNEISDELETPGTLQ